jgi:hypothetical protein
MSNHDERSSSPPRTPWSHDDDEIQHEPIPGLPELLPEGERIVWQGSPDWRRLAVDGFHLPWLAAYFGVFVVARGVAAVALDGATLGLAVAQAALVVPLALLGLGLVAALAWGHARATVYTITTRRIVMRLGIALPITFNLPFRELASADVREHGAGTGDIVVQLAGTNRLGWLHLWPHARPWHISRAQPMLRCVPRVKDVAAALAAAVATSPHTTRTHRVSGAAPSLQLAAEGLS